VVVKVKTKPHVQIVVRAQLRVRLPATGKGQSHGQARDTVVYQQTVQARANGQGLATAHVRVTYAPSGPIHGQLDVRVQTPVGLVVRTLNVTVKR
jgi:hypothetical protein